MRVLTLPRPAAELWTATRDTLTNLGHGPERWSVAMSGGTVLAARIGHRESTDIDLVVINKNALQEQGLLEESDLAGKLGGREVLKNPGQIKIEMPTGMIDLSTAPVIPPTGSRIHIISEQPQLVLSTTQIMRGKMSRANDPAPVRDVYDVIRTSLDNQTAAELTAAYNMLIEDEQDTIESEWITMDAVYEEAASNQLRLTEPPCTDLSSLGSTAARILHDHRIERVVVSIDDGRLRVDRTTRHGRSFTDFPATENPVETIGALGVYPCIGRHGGTAAGILKKAAETQGAGADGVIFDTAGELQTRPRPRTREPRARTTTGTGDDTTTDPPSATEPQAVQMRPPSPNLRAGRTIDHSSDPTAIRGKGLPAGGVLPGRAIPNSPTSTEREPKR